MNRHPLPLLAALLLTSASLADGLIIPAKFDIPANKETTYLTAPLCSDGTVNYLRGLEDLLAKDITPENNAFFPLLQIAGTGKDSIDPAFKEDLVKRFHIPESTNQWVPFKPENRKETDDLFECGKVPWTKADHPRFAEWLDKNQAALAAVTEAAKRDRLCIPLWCKDDYLYNRQTPLLGRIRDYANTLTERAMLRLGSGDLDGCCQDLLTTHRLARLVSRGVTVPETLQASAIEYRASQSEVAFALTGKTTAPFIAAYLAERDKLPPFHPFWECVEVGERCEYLDFITRIARFGRAANIISDEPPVSEEDEVPFNNEELAHVDFVPVLKRINVFFDKQVAFLKIEDPAARAAAEKEFLALFPASELSKEEIALAKTKDVTKAFGDWALTKVPDFGRARMLEQRNFTRSTLARITLALAAYHADHNAYPDQLADLTPKYLPAIPLDPFSSKPFRYQHTAPDFLLYSIGPDLIDNNGAPESQGKGDIVIATRKTPKP